MSPADSRDLAAHQAHRLRTVLAALPANRFYARKFGIGSETSPPDPFPEAGRGRKAVLLPSPLRGGVGGGVPEHSPGTQHSSLVTLPFTTKAELIADQAAHPPYGTGLTYPLDRYNRLHQTSGTTTGRPLCWLDTPEPSQCVLDQWRSQVTLIGLPPAGPRV